MALERGAGFEAFVGRSSRAEHEDMLASARYVYFLGLDVAGDAGRFRDPCAISTIPMATSTSSASLSTRPGRGRGTEFLALLIDWAFRETSAHRFYLDCFDDNVRAERAYEKLGCAARASCAAPILRPTAAGAIFI